MSKKIKLGIIGSGVIVRNFIAAAQKVEGLELFAFYSRTLEKAQEFQSDYGFSHIYTDLDEMADNADYHLFCGHEYLYPQYSNSPGGPYFLA